jgi:hypothetical protein
MQQRNVGTIALQGMTYGVYEAFHERAKFDLAGRLRSESN